MGDQELILIHLNNRLTEINAQLEILPQRVRASFDHEIIVDAHDLTIWAEKYINDIRNTISISSEMDENVFLEMYNVCKQIFSLEQNIIGVFSEKSTSVQESSLALTSKADTITNALVSCANIINMIDCSTVNTEVSKEIGSNTSIKINSSVVETEVVK